MKVSEGIVTGINHYDYTSKTTGEVSKRTNIQFNEGGVLRNANVSFKQFKNYLNNSPGMAEENLLGSEIAVTYWETGETTSDILNPDGSVARAGIDVTKDFTLVNGATFRLSTKQMMAKEAAKIFAQSMGITAPAPAAPVVNNTPPPMGNPEEGDSGNGVDFEKRTGEVPAEETTEAEEAPAEEAAEAPAEEATEEATAEAEAPAEEAAKQ